MACWALGLCIHHQPARTGRYRETEEKANNMQLSISLFWIIFISQIGGHLPGLFCNPASPGSPPSWLPCSHFPGWGTSSAGCLCLDSLLSHLANSSFSCFKVSTINAAPPPPPPRLSLVFRRLSVLLSWQSSSHHMVTLSLSSVTEGITPVSCPALGKFSINICWMSEN